MTLWPVLPVTRVVVSIEMVCGCRCSTPRREPFIGFSCIAMHSSLARSAAAGESSLEEEWRARTRTFCERETGDIIFCTSWERGEARDCDFGAHSVQRPLPTKSSSQYIPPAAAIIILLLLFATYAMRLPTKRRTNTKSAPLPRALSPAAPQSRARLNL